MWSALHHPNVLPLLGATMTGARFTMVSEWMKDGNINEFVKAHPVVDQLKLVGPHPMSCPYLLLTPVDYRSWKTLPVG